VCVKLCDEVVDARFEGSREIEGGVVEYRASAVAQCAAHFCIGTCADQQFQVPAAPAALLDESQPFVIAMARESKKAVVQGDQPHNRLEYDGAFAKAWSSVNLSYVEDRKQLPTEIEPSDVTFVLCIEGTGIERQGLLLCEALREFGGKFRNAAAVAVSPRPDTAIGADSRALLDELNVTYVVEPLNVTGHSYLPINRMVTGAWAERNLSTDYVVLLDTDTLFAREPTFYAVDAGVRPVDEKGSTSSGSDDPLDKYWRRICELANIALEDLPFLTTSVDGQRVRASYNGGFCIVRRSLGILQKTDRVFAASLREGLRPLANRRLNLFTSVGYVGRAASEFWGSSQATLSAAIASLADDVLVYDPAYNVPLHLLVPEDGKTADWPLDPVLVHYHWLLQPGYQSELLGVLERLEVRPEFRTWLAHRLG
jgi:hypothetical protein